MGFLLEKCKLAKWDEKMQESWRVIPITEEDAVVNKRDLTEELRGALMEAKEMIEGKRKLNTLSHLIHELRNPDE